MEMSNVNEDLFEKLEKKIYLTDSFKEACVDSMKLIKGDEEKEKLVQQISSEISSIYSEDKKNNNALVIYPAKLTSCVIVANCYEQIKDTKPKYLAVLSYATFYCTGGVVDEMVELFGDGVIIGKVINKTDYLYNDSYSRKVSSLNTIGSLLKHYRALKKATTSSEVIPYLTSYVDNLKPVDLRKLEPLYTDENVNGALNNISFNGGKK